MKKLTSAILALMTMSFASTAVVHAAEGDSVNPSNVANVTATPLSGAVDLSWDEATDDEGVEGYQVYYGTAPAVQPGHQFDENVDVGDVTEYKVTGLNNGTEYFFAVIAYDEDGNESQKWSNQPSATPSDDAGSGDADDEAPEVAEAEAVDKITVKVVFSEAVVLPEEDPQDAFGIENDDTFEPLVVEDAVIDEEDETGKTVLLTTAEQQENVAYTLTVGIDVEDKAGNQIISGTSDTATFDGSGEEPEMEDEEGPKIVDVEAVDSTHVIVYFDEPIDLATDPSENFEIVAKEDNAITLDVLGVTLDENKAGIDDASAVILTSDQEEIEYQITVLDLMDEFGNELTEDNKVTFEGIAAAGGDDDDDDDAPLPDTVAPEDVANFMAKITRDAEDYIVKLTWNLPTAEDWDSIAQFLYISEDGENFEQKAKPYIDAEEWDVENLEPGEYYFKLTQTDEAGNESEGAIAKVTLSETGPEMLGLLALSVGMGRVFRRKKKRDI